MKTNEKKWNLRDVSQQCIILGKIVELLPMIVSVDWKEYLHFSMSYVK